MSKKLRLFRHFKRFKKSKRGQASILVALMLVTFVQIFMVVVNVGLLVNAKINLQNAADLAAYAGAAVQARQMTQVGFLNYEMRRQLKKFMFRYHVIGTMAQKSFPTGKSPADEDQGELREYGPAGRASGRKFGVPIVCLNFDAKDNFCSLDKLPKIQPNPINPLDSISATLNQQLQTLESIRQNNCGTIGATNYSLLTLWLYNTDPEGQDVQARLDRLAGGDDAAKVAGQRMKAIGFLGQGLGLIPKMSFLFQRIKNLEHLINAKPFQAMDRDKIDTLMNRPETPIYERTIQAFLTAFLSLGGPATTADSRGFFAFPGGTNYFIKMDELIPGDEEKANLIRLEKLTSSFDSYYLRFPGLDGGGPVPRFQSTPAAYNSATDCEPSAGRFEVNNLPVGVTKDPNQLVYYAIQLSAKPQLMFDPFRGGDGTKLEIRAYAAAQPFGSRIGPPKEMLNPNEFGVFVNPARANFNVETLCTQCKGILNVPITEDDQINKGYNRTEYQKEIFKALVKDLSQTEVATIQQPDVERAYGVAMAPQPWEAGRYLIPFDIPGDEFVQYFNPKHMTAIYAPVNNVMKQGSGGSSDLLQEMSDTFDAIQEPTLRNALRTGLETYFSRLQACNGEDVQDSNPATQGLKECSTFAILSDPLNHPTGFKVNEIPGIKKDFILSERSKIATAWSHVQHEDFARQGRIGYSVRFIPMKSVASSGASGGIGDVLPIAGPGGFGAPLTNPVRNSGTLQEDLRALEH